MKKLKVGLLLFGSLIVSCGVQARLAQAKFIFKNFTDENLNIEVATNNAKKFYVNDVPVLEEGVPNVPYKFTISAGKASHNIKVKSVDWEGKVPVFRANIVKGNIKSFAGGIEYTAGNNYLVNITGASPRYTMTTIKLLQAQFTFKNDTDENLTINIQKVGAPDLYVNDINVGNDGFNISLDAGHSDVVTLRSTRPTFWIMVHKEDMTSIGYDSGKKYLTTIIKDKDSDGNYKVKTVEQ